MILIFRITHTVVLDDPFDDPAGLEVPPKSPEPTKDLTEVLSLLLILLLCLIKMLTPGANLSGEDLRLDSGHS